MSQSVHHREFEKKIKGLCHRHHLWRVFADFCEMAAISIANSVTIGPVRDKREARYMDIVSHYSKEMVIGFALALMDRKINYQQAMHATCVDLDNTAAHMAYIQLSLMHIPALVLVGNSLSLEMRESWYTPAHIMGFWDQKQARGYALGSKADQANQPKPEPMDLQQMKQADMFGEAAA